MVLTVERKGFVAPDPSYYSTPSEFDDMTLLPPEASSSEPQVVELCSSDIAMNGMNMKAALYFDQVLSKERLKTSLAQVSGGSCTIHHRDHVVIKIMSLSSFIDYNTILIDYIVPSYSHRANGLW